MVNFGPQLPSVVCEAFCSFIVSVLPRACAEMSAVSSAVRRAELGDGPPLVKRQISHLTCTDLSPSLGSTEHEKGQQFPARAGDSGQP